MFGSARCSRGFAGAELSLALMRRIYIRMACGFLHLVAVMEWFSRFVLSRRLSSTLEADFCRGTLEEALPFSPAAAASRTAWRWSAPRWRCERIMKSARPACVDDPVEIGLKNDYVAGAMLEQVLA